MKTKLTFFALFLLVYVAFFVAGCPAPESGTKISIPIECVRQAGEDFGRLWFKTDKRPQAEKIAFIETVGREMEIRVPDEYVLSELIYISIYADSEDLDAATVNHLVSFWVLRWQATGDRKCEKRARAFFRGFTEGAGR